MSEIPCKENPEFSAQKDALAETLKTQLADLLGRSDEDIYQSGLFRAAVERLRGQFSATMHPKREFIARVLSYLQDGQYIQGWESTGGNNRHDYTVTMASGKVAVIEAKGCLDGNNTNIYERPAHADEFVIWSICSNPGADPRLNAWSGIHTRLSAEMVVRPQHPVDGLVVWDWICGTIARPCPKLAGCEHRRTNLGPHQLTPPCIYVFPSTIAGPRTNRNPKAQPLQNVEFLSALHAAFNGADDEVNYVDFALAYVGNDLARSTTIRRDGMVQKTSGMTIIRRGV